MWYPPENGRFSLRHMPVAFVKIHGLARFLGWDIIIFSNHDSPFRHDAKKIYVRHGVSFNKMDKNDDPLIIGEYSYDFFGKYKYDLAFVESKKLRDMIAKKNHDSKFICNILKPIDNFLSTRLTNLGAYLIIHATKKD